MADMPSELLPHVVTVTPVIDSDSAYGDSTGDPIPVPCFVRDKRTAMRGPDGVEIVVDTVIIARLEHADTLATGAEVALPWGGRVVHVKTVARHDDGGLGAWQHLEAGVS